MSSVLESARASESRIFIDFHAIFMDFVVVSRLSGHIEACPATSSAIATAGA